MITQLEFLGLAEPKEGNNVDWRKASPMICIFYEGNIWVLSHEEESLHIDIFESDISPCGTRFALSLDYSLL